MEINNGEEKGANKGQERENRRNERKRESPNLRIAPSFPRALSFAYTNSRPRQSIFSLPALVLPVSRFSLLVYTLLRATQRALPMPSTLLFQWQRRYSFCRGTMRSSCSSCGPPHSVLWSRRSPLFPNASGHASRVNSRGFVLVNE